MGSQVIIKMQSVRKDEEEKNEEIILKLLARISELAGVICFKFDM